MSNIGGHKNGPTVDHDGENRKETTNPASNTSFKATNTFEASFIHNVEAEISSNVEERIEGAIKSNDSGISTISSTVYHPADGDQSSEHGRFVPPRKDPTGQYASGKFLFLSLSYLYSLKQLVLQVCKSLNFYKFVASGETCLQLWDQRVTASLHIQTVSQLRALACLTAASSSLLSRSTPSSKASLALVPFPAPTSIPPLRLLSSSRIAHH